MIKNDTIVSTTDGRFTLLQWLNKVEDALKNASATAVKAVPQADGKVVFEIDFADGTNIKSDPFELPEKLPEGYAVDVAGNITLNGGLLVDKVGNVEMGKNAIVDGTLTLNTPENLIFKTGSINPTPEGYAVDGAGNVTIAGALKANNNGDVEVLKNLKVDGKAKLGYAGKAAFILNGLSIDFFVYEAILIGGGKPAPRFVAFLPIIENITTDEISIPAIKDIWGYLINNSDGTPATTIDEALNGVLGDIPFTVALNGEWNYAEFGELRVYSGKIQLSADSSDFVDLRLIPTASQAKYQHTVHLITYSDTDKQLNVSFTARSSKSNPVDSYIDLRDVFGGCNLALSGLIKYQSALIPVYLDLHGGTIETDKIYAVDPSNPGAWRPQTLSSFPNITFTDDVVPE